jgi:hypothetical protein
VLVAEHHSLTQLQALAVSDRTVFRYLAETAPSLG